MRVSAFHDVNSHRHHGDSVDSSSNNGSTRAWTGPLAAVTAAATLSSATLLAAPQAVAQEADLATAEGIIAELERISRDTEAVSQQVLEIDARVSEKADELTNAERAHAESEGRVLNAQGELDRLSGDISYFAKKRMRGEIIDPLTAALGAVDAQDAIDRTSYVNKFFRDNSNTVSQAADAAETARSEQNRALRLQDDVKKQLADLERDREKLQQREAELENRTQQVRSMVDNLSPEQRAAWISKNNPITPMLDNIAGTAGVVGAAMTKLGAPYSWGAAGPDSFDCSGLMYWAYQQMGKTIPRTSQAQLAGGTPVSRDQLQPGDIIGFYPGITHVGMYIGNGQIIHASDYGIPVQVVSIDQGGPYQGAVRF